MYIRHLSKRNLHERLLQYRVLALRPLPHDGFCYRDLVPIYDHRYAARLRFFVSDLLPQLAQGVKRLWGAFAIDARVAFGEGLQVLLVRHLSVISLYLCDQLRLQAHL